MFRPAHRSRHGTHIAEEIEEIRQRAHHGLLSRLEILISHILKWQVRRPTGPAVGEAHWPCDGAASQSAWRKYRICDDT
jgi:hypothetical protein